MSSPIVTIDTSVKRWNKFTSGREFDPFSRVVIIVSEELEYTAGKEDGRTLTLTCPWGTQQIADDILADIKGKKYRPYTATGAFLDPSAELGDRIMINYCASGLCTSNSTFGKLYKADIAAPAEEEIDHEYPYVSKQERIVERKIAQVASEFKVQAGEISAKVSKTGGSDESFGWNLDEKSWTLKSKGTDVLRAYEEGVEITGKIVAKSGKIGGFDILSDHLSYNGQTWLGTNALGAYLGINGIQLGKNFRVDMQGNLYAASGEFSGTVKAGNIEYGEKGGYLDGGAITAGTISAGKYGPLSSGVRSSLGYADYSNDVFNEKQAAPMIRCKGFRYDTSKGKFYLSPITISYMNAGGGTSSVTVLGYRGKI